MVAISAPYCSSLPLLALLTRIPSCYGVTATDTAKQWNGLYSVLIFKSFQCCMIICNCAVVLLTADLHCHSVLLQELFRSIVPFYLNYMTHRCRAIACARTGSCRPLHKFGGHTVHK